jgi:hypothetical protein
VGRLEEVEQGLEYQLAEYRQVLVLSDVLVAGVHLARQLARSIQLFSDKGNSEQKGEEEE